MEFRDTASMFDELKCSIRLFLFSYFMVWWATEFKDTATFSTSVPLHYAHSPTSWSGGPQSLGILLIFSTNVQGYCFMFDDCSIILRLFYFMVLGILLHIQGVLDGLGMKIGLLQKLQVHVARHISLDNSRVGMPGMVVLYTSNPCTTTYPILQSCVKYFSMKLGLKLRS